MLVPWRQFRSPGSSVAEAPGMLMGDLMRMFGLLHGK